MTIKNFSIEYDAINSENTFTNGDTIRGRVIVEVSKETKIQSLVFIGKGHANVCWTEHYGQNNFYVYHSKEKYYEVKHHILREARQDGTEVIGKGRHVFPFSFNIPDRNIPSSFKSSIGKIVHKLKAELKQSMKVTKTAKTHFTFVSRAGLGTPGLMVPQYGCKDKTIKVFGSGNISMDVHTKSMGYLQGDGVQVTIEIKNHSTRSVKPRIILYEKKSYLAQGHRKVCTNEILKEKTEAVASGGSETVTKVITIPKELPVSILNCSIIKLEYRLKVSLDVKYAVDPKIKLPIVVLPVVRPMKHPTPMCGVGNPNLGPWGRAPQPFVPALDPPPPYGAYAMCPSSKYADDT